jgi:hypothetical protein
MILTCMNRILKNPQKYEINTFTAMKDTDPGDEAVVYGINPNQEKGVFVAGFAA